MVKGSLLQFQIRIKLCRPQSFRGRAVLMRQQATVQDPETAQTKQAKQITQLCHLPHRTLPKTFSPLLTIKWHLQPMQKVAKRYPARLFQIFHSHRLKKKYHRLKLYLHHSKSRNPWLYQGMLAHLRIRRLARK